MPEEPGWYPDPKNEAPFRFYDGRKWTKSVADQQPQAERVDDGPVEGGLMGLLEHERVNDPMPEIERPASTGYVPLGDHIPLTAPTWGPMPEPDAAAPPPPPQAPQADWPPPAAPAPPPQAPAPPPPAAAPPPPPPPPPADQTPPPPPAPPPPPPPPPPQR